MSVNGEPAALHASPARRTRAYVSMLGTTQMHLRTPAIIGLWSAIFPGLGHLLLSKYISGMLLFGWEIFINVNSHLNLSIFYTFTLRFDEAKAVLDQRGCSCISPPIFLPFGTATGPLWI